MGSYKMSRSKTQLMKILELLDKEGPLSSKKISEISGVPYGTVRSYNSILSRSGLLKRFKDLRGIYILTDKGRKTLLERQLR